MVAGDACAVGVDGTRMLYLADPVEEMALAAIAEHAAKTVRQLDLSRAQMIGNAVARAFGGR